MDERPRSCEKNALWCQQKSQAFTDLAQTCGKRARLAGQRAIEATHGALVSTDGSNQFGLHRKWAERWIRLAERYTWWAELVQRFQFPKQGRLDPPLELTVVSHRQLVLEDQLEEFAVTEAVAGRFQEPDFQALEQPGETGPRTVGQGVGRRPEACRRAQSGPRGGRERSIVKVTTPQHCQEALQNSHSWALQNKPQFLACLRINSSGEQAA